MYWYYMVVIACALLVFLLYREWRRTKKSGLHGRLLACVLSVGSLLWMAHPPEQKSSAAVKQLVILTDGFIEDSVADFIQQRHSEIPIYSDNPALKYPANNIQLIAGWHLFARQHAAATFHVFGNGLEAAALNLLNNHPIVFHAPPARSAVSNIYWKQWLQTGEALKVQGTYENHTAKRIKIVLEVFGEERDTVLVDAGTSRQFSMATTPLHTGRAVYSLVFLSGRDTLAQEPIPVEVQTIAPLKILIIASSPDFDNTYLKNHLSQQGYQVSISTEVSTNTSNRQFLNTPVQQAGAVMSAAYLSKFDVVIANQEALQKMNSAALGALRTVVADKGTGLLVKIDEQKNSTAFYSHPFPVKAVPQDKEVYRWLMPAITDSGRYKIKMTAPLAIVYQPGLQVILQDAQSNAYAAATQYGSGKIVASTLQNTFSMGLAGDKASWQALWSLLLNKASRKEYPVEKWHTQQFIPIQNVPEQLQVERLDSSSTKALAGNSTVYLSQNDLLPYLWQGTYWPGEIGWQTLPQVNTASGYWYVYRKGDWQQLFNHRLTSATHQYAASHPYAVSKEMDTAGNKFMAGIRIWLLIVFLAACIFIWVEQKLG